MKSLPILEAFFVLCLFGAVAYPLHVLTGSAPVQVESRAEEVADRSLVEGFISLRFAHPPQLVRLVDDDERVVFETMNTDLLTRMDADVQLVVEQGSTAELRIKAEWDTASPETAVEVRIEPDGADTFVKTLWATGALDARMTIPVHE